MSETQNGTGDGFEEHILRGLFRELLEKDSLGDEESFFQLAGDSITVLKLVSRARVGGLHLSIPDVFECRTVLALAARARANRVSAEENPGVAQEAAGSLVSISQDELDEFESDE
jgi:aryl carrier-like protein